MSPIDLLISIPARHFCGSLPPLRRSASPSPTSGRRATTRQMRLCLPPDFLQSDGNCLPARWKAGGYPGCLLRLLGSGRAGDWFRQGRRARSLGAERITPSLVTESSPRSSEATETECSPQYLMTNPWLREKLDACLEPVREKLVDLRLSHTDAETRRADIPFWIALLVMCAAGGTRLVLGISRGRPVLYLVLLIAAALVAWVWARKRKVCRATQLGRRYLQSLEIFYEPIKSPGVREPAAGRRRLCTDPGSFRRGRPGIQSVPSHPSRQPLRLRKALAQAAVAMVAAATAVAVAAAAVAVAAAVGAAGVVAEGAPPNTGYRPRDNARCSGTSPSDVTCAAPTVIRTMTRYRKPPLPIGSGSWISSWRLQRRAPGVDRSRSPAASPWRTVILPRLMERLAADASLSVAVLTNGTLIDAAIARRLRSWRPRFVQVSLDGDRATHDRIRGAGAFDRAVTGLECLVREDIPAFMAFTAHRDNYRDVPRRWRAWGVSSGSVGSGPIA